MKILAVSYDYPPTIGGIATHVQELYQAIAATTEGREGHEDHEVHILTKPIKNIAPTNKDGRVHLHSLPRRFLRPFYGYQINARIDKLCKIIAPDIIHLHGLLPLHGLTPKPAPIVFTNHSSGYLNRLQKGKNSIKKLDKLFAPIDLLLAPSEDRLHTISPLRAKTAYIPNGVVVEKFMRNTRNRTRLRNSFGVKEDEPLAIITSRLEPVKGILDLANATQYIQHPKLKLLIIGGGKQETEIADVLEKNFYGRFIMTGEMSHTQIAPYYSAADFAILPSLMEATSISCLEAMAASLPIVASNVGGLPTLVRDGENGILCPPQKPRALAAAIDNLLASDLAEMGAISHTRTITDFTWQKTASATLDAYRKIL